MTENLSFNKVKWILKEYQKCGDIENVHCNWEESFGTQPYLVLQLTNCKISLKEESQFLMQRNMVDQLLLGLRITHSWLLKLLKKALNHNYELRLSLKSEDDLYRGATVSQF